MKLEQAGLQSLLCCFEVPESYLHEYRILVQGNRHIPKLSSEGTLLNPTCFLVQRELFEFRERVVKVIQSSSKPRPPASPEQILALSHLLEIPY